MILLLAIGAVIALCALLWRTAIYALPVLVGLSSTFWSLSLGAGLGAVFVGLAAGQLSWEIAKHAFARGNMAAKVAVSALLVCPAACLGFEMVWQITAHAIPSHIWRIFIGTAAGIATSATAFVRLSKPNQ